MLARTFVLLIAAFLLCLALGPVDQPQSRANGTRSAAAATQVDGDERRLDQPYLATALGLPDPPTGSVADPVAAPVAGGLAQAAFNPHRWLSLAAERVDPDGSADPAGSVESADSADSADTPSAMPSSVPIEAAHGLLLATMQRRDGCRVPPFLLGLRRPPRTDVAVV